jgi:hypothetical protein
MYGIKQAITVDGLGQVDERLTVYSQLQRRNVRQRYFRDELDQLMGELRKVGGPIVGEAGKETIRGRCDAAVTHLRPCTLTSGRLGPCAGRKSR